MATELQTKTAHCPTHGPVKATRRVPGPSFPFAVFAVRRFIATRKPFRCPECNTPVSSE